MSIWKILVYTLLLLAAIVVWCLGCTAFGQEAARVTSTPWQIETQAHLDACGMIAAKENRNIGVIIPPGRYELVSLRIPRHVYLSFGSALAPAEGDLVYVGNGGDTCITLDGRDSTGKPSGYGMGLYGCKIRPKNQSVQDVISVQIDGCLNPKLANVRSDFRGDGCLGLLVSGGESIVVERCEFRAPAPFVYDGADNVCFRDMDLGCIGEAVVTLKRNPHMLVFEGSQTWQGGRLAVLGKTTDQTTGQSLTLNNVRWEQSTSVDDPNCPGILIECEGRAFECLNQINCRWSARKNRDTVVRFNPAQPLVPKLTEVGCFKPRR